MRACRQLRAFTVGETVGKCLRQAEEEPGAGEHGCALRGALTPLVIRTSDDTVCRTATWLHRRGRSPTMMIGKLDDHDRILPKSRNRDHCWCHSYA
jgi:hypothetical protein